MLWKIFFLIFEIYKFLKTIFYKFYFFWKIVDFWVEIFSNFKLKNLKEKLPTFLEKYLTIFDQVKFLLFSYAKLIFFLIHYYFKSFYDLVLDFLIKLIDDKEKAIEYRSGFMFLFLSFIFYYFIVIELSNYLFGYSLLCYWFLFIQLIIFAFLAWWFEVTQIWYYLWLKNISFTTLWKEYCDEVYPFTMMNSLLNYSNFFFFKLRIYHSPKIELPEQRLDSVLIGSLFIVYTFFFVADRFDPTWVWFVSQYFRPQSSFEDDWSEPRFGEMFYAFSWLRNDIMWILKWVYWEDKTVMSILNAIPGKSRYHYSMAYLIHRQRFALRHHTNYSDIYYLRVLREYPPAARSYFSEGFVWQTDDKGANRHLYFAWFLWGQFSYDNHNFWVKYFKEDRSLWSYIMNSKKIVNETVERADQNNLNAPLYEHTFKSSYQSAVLSKNYFHPIFFTGKKMLSYGSQRENYWNITRPHQILSDEPSEREILHDTLTSSWKYKTKKSSLGWDISIKNHEQPTRLTLYRYNVHSFLDEAKISFKIFKERGFSLNDFFDVSEVDKLSGYESPELYKFSQLVNFKKSTFIDPSQRKYWFRNSTKKYNKRSLLLLMWIYDKRLTGLERWFGVWPSMRWSSSQYKKADWWYLITLIKWRMLRLEIYIDDSNMFYFIESLCPSFYEFKSLLKSFIISPYWWWWNPKLNFILDVLWIKYWYYFKVNKDIWTELVFLDTYLTTMVNKGSHFTKRDFFLKKNKKWYFLWPWIVIPDYMKTVQYFSYNDLEFTPPVPARYVTFTPWESFSAFSKTWLNLEALSFQKGTLENWEIIERYRFADIYGNPIFEEEEEGEDPYMQPLIIAYEWIIFNFYWIMSYIFEYCIKKTDFMVNSPKLTTVAIVFYFSTTLHVYIGVLICIYLYFLFAYSSFYTLNFTFLHDVQFEQKELWGSRDYYWHQMTDIWLHYKTPEQIALLSFQTSLLMHYTFFNLNNYSVVFNNKCLPFLQYFSSTLIETKPYVDFFHAYGNYTEFGRNLLSLKEFVPFWSFFYLQYKKYTALLFYGGSDCNMDSMLWSYYDYLAQVSIYVSWNLNKINTESFILKYKRFSNLIKQATVLFSSFSLTSNFFFLSMPLLDTSLSKKIIHELFFMINQFWFFDKKQFVDDFLFCKNSEYFIIKQGLFLELRYTFFTYFFWSGLDSYKLFEYKNLFDLSKTNFGNYWDSIKYWIFAFLRSFRFISKTRFPTNFHIAHESSRLKLRWMAYSNSWIGSSIHIWPFFNLIQHIWWTSRTMNWAFSLTDFSTNLNVSGVNSYDNVWNFFEKRYSNSFATRRETVFGIVWSFSINMKNIFSSWNLHDPNINDIGFEIDDYNQYKWDRDTDYLLEDYIDVEQGTFMETWWNTKKAWKSHEDQWNFYTNYSSTYNILFNDFRSTERGHDKVNPPLNVSELGITPNQLLNIFWNLPSSYKLIYLTFLDQINYIDLNDKNLLPSPERIYINNKKTVEYEPIKEILEDEDLIDIAISLGWVEGKIDSWSTWKVDRFLWVEFPSNNIFGFDVTFFLNHFLTWDYFSNSNFNFEWSTKTINSQESQLYKLYNKIYAEIEIEPNFTDSVNNSWRTTPFGTIQSYEAIIMQWYKFTKVFDELSLTNYWEDPFISLNNEHYKTHIGLSHISTVDKISTSSEAYKEEYFAQRHRRFPYTNLLTKNIVGPIFIGWVGDIYYSTIDSTSMLFSLLYATDSLEPNIWSNEWSFYGLRDSETFEAHQIEELESNGLIIRWSSFGLHFPEFPWFYTFYAYDDLSPTNTLLLNRWSSKLASLSQIWWKMYIKAFSWLNLILYPTAFWYFFGVKSSARLDYWSWQCDLTFDYCLGHFNYWPYLQPRHSFGTRLAIYDSYYGYYRSYRQREDDPSIVDVSTGIMERELNLKDEEEEDDIPFILYTYDYLDEDSVITLQNLSYMYWWLYYSFHHPYFAGAVLFWFLVFVNFSKYLGLANYSFWRFLIKYTTDMNDFTSNNYFDFWLLLSSNRTFVENKYWKNMFRYRNYWMNPIELTNNFDICWDDLTSQKNDWSEQLSISYEWLFILVNMLSVSFDIKISSLFKFLDFKWIYLQLLNINWLVLDNPFPLNPYVVYNNIFQSWKGSINYEWFYYDYFFSHSHYNSLWEPLNLNLFFDWSVGTYFDKINLKSYYSAYRTTTELGITNFYAPSALGMFNTLNDSNYDESLKGAVEMNKEYSVFDVYFHEPDDVTISHQSMFHNLAILKFLTFYSSDVFFYLLGSSSEMPFDKMFFDFYFSPDKDYWTIFKKLKLLPLWNTENKLEENVDKHLIVSNWFLYSDSLKWVKKMPDTKHMLFMFWLYWYIPYDMLLLWLDTGILFFNSKDWVKLHKLVKFSITSKFYQLEKFYTWIGFKLFFSTFNWKK